METAFQKEIYESMETVWSGASERESAQECVVPDAMPDIGTVLDAQGLLCVRGKETEAGVVRLNASVTVSVVYAPEDGGAPRSLEVTLPGDMRMEAEGADGECLTTASVRLRSLEARALNSRKLAVRAELEAAACVRRRTSTELCCGLEGEAPGTHILTRTAEAVPVADVREKTFAVTDEYQLPAGAAQEILSRRVEAMLDDVQYVSGKAVFRGRVRSELLLSAAEEGGRPSAVRYETEFSQLMEVGTGSAQSQPEITLLITGAYFDPPEYGEGGGRLSAEIHMAAQCVCRERRSIPYIADIYSSRTELVPETETLCPASDVRGVSMRQTVAGTAEPFEGGEIVQTTAAAGSVSAEGGTVKTSVQVRVIYRREDGRYAAARCRLPAEFTLSELPEGASLSDMRVTVTDAYASPGAAGTADVRAALQMDAVMTARTELTAVRGVTEDAEAFRARERTPSVTLLRVPAGTDMWSLAKKYRSTAEAIAGASEGRQEGLILIPRAR